MKHGLSVILVFGALSWASHSHAILITTSIGDYDVTTIDNSGSAVTEVWWGNAGLAAEFATLVGASLGFQASPPWLAEMGPLFAVSASSGYVYYAGSVVELSGAITTTTIQTLWATAREVSVPEPSTLGLLGFGLLGLAFVRRKWA